MSSSVIHVFVCEHNYAHVYQKCMTCCRCADGVCPAYAHQNNMFNGSCTAKSNDYAQFTALGTDLAFAAARGEVQRHGDVLSTFLCTVILYIEHDIAFVQAALYFRDEHGPKTEVARINVTGSTPEGIYQAGRNAFMYAIEEAVSPSSKDYEVVMQDARYEISDWDFSEPLVFVLDRTEYL